MACVGTEEQFLDWKIASTTSANRARVSVDLNSFSTANNWTVSCSSVSVYVDWLSEESIQSEPSPGARVEWQRRRVGDRLHLQGTAHRHSGKRVEYSTQNVEKVCSANYG